jgi:hypothetical protein
MYLEKNIKYKFASVTYIENKHHVFNGNLESMMTNFIEKYIINDKTYENENYCILHLFTFQTPIIYKSIFIKIRYNEK